jgi:hypothetical protein
MNNMDSHQFPQQPGISSAEELSPAPTGPQQNMSSNDKESPSFTQ